MLSATPETIGKLSRELRKGVRTGPIVVYGAEDAARKSHMKLAEVAVAQAQRLLADLEGQRRKEKELAAAEELGRRLNEYRGKLDRLRRQSKGKLDAATWKRVDAELQTLIG